MVILTIIIIHNNNINKYNNYSGIIFPVQCKELLPIERLVITSISVRGMLGPITVWVSHDPTDGINQHDDHDHDHNSDGDNQNSNDVELGTARLRRPRFYDKKNNIITIESTKWTQIYSKQHSPSPYTYQKLDLSQSPIQIQPGQVRGIYIHSSLPGDEAIVYDNYTIKDAHNDKRRNSSNSGNGSILTILPAMAHVSNEPFGTQPIWGWGDAWRRGRKFVGQIEYGVIYRLWTPQNHVMFGSKFQQLALTLFGCQRRMESPMSRLPDECIYYILNMCKWDWMGDDGKGMLKMYEKKQKKERERAEKRMERSIKKGDKRGVDEGNMSNNNEHHLLHQGNNHLITISGRTYRQIVSGANSTVINVLYNEADRQALYGNTLPHIYRVLRSDGLLLVFFVVLVIVVLSTFFR